MMGTQFVRIERRSIQLPARAPRLISLLALVLASLSACGSDDQAQTPRVSTIPATLRGFLLTRGVPQVYAIAFADQELNDKGTATSAASIRRMETWIWLGEESTRAVFDSGYLVESTTLTTTLTTALTPRSPTDFHGTMTPEEVEGLVGTTYTDESGALGKASLVVRRYAATTNVPPQAFGFVDGRLTSVVVGAAMEVN